MRKLAIAVALASTAMATPLSLGTIHFTRASKAASCGSKTLNFDYDGLQRLTITAGVTIMHNSGFDVDAIAGYDFGMVRLEGELGYKHARSIRSSSTPRFRVRVRSTISTPMAAAVRFQLMVNLLLDFGNEDGLSGYVGAGYRHCQMSSMSPDADTPNGIVGFSDSDSGSRVAGHRGPSLCGQPEHRPRPEVSLLQRHEPQVRRTQRGRPDGSTSRAAGVRTA